MALWRAAAATKACSRRRSVWSADIRGATARRCKRGRAGASIPSITPSGAVAETRKPARTAQRMAVQRIDARLDAPVRRCQQGAGRKGTGCADCRVSGRGRCGEAGSAGTDRRDPPCRPAPAPAPACRGKCQGPAGQRQRLFDQAPARTRLRRGGHRHPGVRPRQQHAVAHVQRGRQGFGNRRQDQGQAACGADRRRIVPAQAQQGLGGLSRSLPAHRR
jgi:hypothetical protein